MVKLLKWQFTCLTENIDKTIWLEDGQATPTTCPTNSAHSILSGSARVVDVKEDNVVSIKEELIETGGNFQATTFKMETPANTTSTKTIIFPMAITALEIEYASDSSHTGDIISLSGSKDQIIGIITAGVSSASAWSSQNYTVGQKVSYTHPLHGARVYTCIVNTVSNEAPSNTTYWRHGFELSVSPTVLQYTMLGYYINLYNGATTDDMGRVVFIDKTNSKIYVEKNTTNSYSGMTTYVRQTVYAIKDYEIGLGGIKSIGSSSIGGSYVPSNSVIVVEYKNNSLTDAKTLVACLEFKY